MLRRSTPSSFVVVAIFADLHPTPMLDIFTPFHRASALAVCRLGALVSVAMLATSPLGAQAATTRPAPSGWTAEDDHRDMMRQLGITALRPGPSGNEQAPNHANYDEAKANPFPRLPDVLTLRGGRRVTTPRQWAARRDELVEDFEREVYGRIPKNVPAVTWEVVGRDTGTIAGRRVEVRQLRGQVDNSAYPAITLDIPATLVVPADAKRPVPAMIMFTFFPNAVARALGRPVAPPPAGQRVFTPPPPAPGSDAPPMDQLIVDGWGVVVLDPTDIQADNGAGLRKGIIGLANQGRPRKADDWGALRAWGWGASRVLDYLETDRAVNARQVAVEGVSRYGKAALVAMAFDPRFAAVLIGSSGEGGAKLHRRNWGEAVESLTGTGEYHWMAGNFLAYGASEATFGSRNAGDLPVDAHELLALCAPRLTFVSYGVPEKGDAKWLDHQGSFMAAVAAQPVFRLLGAKGLGVSDDYMRERMPPVGVGLLDGELAWRQHDGGHTDAPNFKYFLSWADFHFGRRYTPAAQVPVPASAASIASAPGSQAPARVAPAGGPPADVPAPRTDSNSMIAHRQLLAKRTQGKIDLYFEGNSITRRWGATDYPQFLANWKENFFGWNAADFGWGGDRTENILWRLEQGELDGVNPKVIVLLAGTNNVGGRPGGDEKVADITRGVRAIVELMHRKAPNATIVLTGIFPRNGTGPDSLAVIPEIRRINANLIQLADGRSVRWIDVSDRLADANGKLHEGMMMDGLHPTVQGYRIWADALRPILTELLGPRATTDAAPPPTGDPSARPR
jgi:lysophospholipase L1-like esterase